MKQSKINNYKKLIPNKNLRIKLLTSLSFIPDSIMIKIQYWIKLNFFLNLNNPKRFTEKLQWYKIFFRKNIMKQCSDKFKVREYVKNKNLEYILNDLYGVYDSVKEIPFTKIPKECVIKTTNGNSTNLFYNNNMDINIVKNRIDRWMKQKLFLSGREWCYKGIKPKIIIEKLLKDSKSTFSGINDYKFLCFNGKVEYIVFDVDRFVEHKRNFYDVNWKYLDISSDYPNLGDCIPKPEKLEEMIKVANKLSSEFPFVRVDLYLIEAKIVFGELTFYPWSGYVAFKPDNFDFVLGKKLILPLKE